MVAQGYYHSLLLTCVLKPSQNHNIGTLYVLGGTSILPHANIADFFRLNGTCVVEHWDIVQLIGENPWADAIQSQA